MNQPSKQPLRRGRALKLAVALMVVALLCLAYAVSREHETDPPVSAPTDETIAGASGSAQLSLPDDAAPASLTFDLQEGQSLLLEHSVTATFEASTEGNRALYTIIGLSCGSIEGPTNTQSVNGTENLLHQETRQISQVIAYQAESDGKHRCNARVNAPNWDAEYGDAELTLEATIQPVAEATASNHLATADTEEPIVLAPGDSTVAVDATFPLGSDPTGDIEVLSGTHLTSCTIENGSRDQTEENLCSERMLDRDGSLVSTRTEVELMRDDSACRTVTTSRAAAPINHLVHHRLLDSRARIAGFASRPCGDHIRVRHHVSNEGPAPLVVHRSSTRAAIVIY